MNKHNEDMEIGILGLWHLGCVYSTGLAKYGYKVTGFDTDQQIVARLNKSTPPVFEPNLVEEINNYLNNMAKSNSAFMKPMNVSADLAVVVGKGPMPRSEVVKKLWAYIKKNNLQDTKNKRNINADAALKKVFAGKSVVNMFEMTKLVSAHLS